MKWGKTSALVENGVTFFEALGLGGEEVVSGIEDFDRFDGVALGDGVDDVLAFGHRAEDGVLSVKPRGGDVGDKELAAVGPGSGVGHGEDAGFVVLEFRRALVLEAIARAAAAGAGRVAALDHEVRDDAVEF